MSKLKDPQLTQWDEERDRLNDLAARARKMKLVVPVLPKETTDNQEDEEEDESPFVDNGFCPTGKGGGVDPSCGKGGSVPDASKQTYYVSWTPHQHNPVVAVSIKSEEESLKLSTGATPLNVQVITEKAMTYKEMQSFLDELADREFSRKEITSILHGEGVDVKKITTNSPPPEVPWYTLLGNAFCPTGKGGGVDPTCSPGSNQAAYLKTERVNSGQSLYVQNSVKSGRGKKSAALAEKVIQDQLNKIPDKMRVAGGASTRIEITDKLPKDVPKSAEAHFAAAGDSPGGYLKIYATRPIIPENAAGTAVHEYGHAVDRWLGRINEVGSGWISDDPGFRKAFEMDAAAWKETGKIGHSYVASKPREMFAETYKMLAGGWRGNDNEYASSPQEFLETFPNSAKWIKEMFEI